MGGGGGGEGSSLGSRGPVLQDEGVLRWTAGRLTAVGVLEALRCARKMVRRKIYGAHLPRAEKERYRRRMALWVSNANSSLVALACGVFNVSNAHRADF